MKTYLNEFETIGAKYANQLEEQMKICSVDDFLKYSLQEIHNTTNIDMKRLQQWADVVDLYHIPDLSSRDAEILFHANINSVEELSHRQTIRIFNKIKEIDIDTHYIILQLPTFTIIEQWISYAKLMTRRVKYGQNIPIVMLPIVEMDHAGELKQYKIYTVKDFVHKAPLISGLRKRINMSRHDYKDLLRMVELIKIPGVDLYFAKILDLAGIESAKELMKMDTNEIFNLVNEIQKDETHPLEKMTVEIIEKIKQNIKEKKERK